MINNLYYTLYSIFYCILYNSKTKMEHTRQFMNNLYYTLYGIIYSIHPLKLTRTKPLLDQREGNQGQVVIYNIPAPVCYHISIPNDLIIP